MDAGLLRLLVRGYLPAMLAGVLTGMSWHWLAGLLVFWLGGAAAVLAIAAFERPRAIARSGRDAFPAGAEDGERVT